MTERIAIIGGGIAGLSAAYRLLTESKRNKQAIELRLYEANDRLGGVIRSEKQDDYVIEYGPEAFIVDKPWAYKLCQELGLEKELISTSATKRRAFVAWQGKLHSLPEGFVMIAPTKIWPFLFSSLFSFFGKLRIVCELLIPKNSKTNEESVEEFITRRLGSELFERVGQPLIGGIYTGHAGQLSAQSAIPRFFQLERQYGSLIAGLWRQEKVNTASGARYSLFMSLAGGMSRLVESLVSSLSEIEIKLSKPITKLTRQSKGNWLIQTADEENWEADYVILALPPTQASSILQETDSDIAHDLAAIESASSVVVNFLFRKTDIGRPLNGFGFVVPIFEKCNILAASFISEKFSQRAPDDHVMIRVFIAGALSPKLMEQKDSELESLALADLNKYLTLKGKPIVTKIVRWRHSMPQYKIGHAQLVDGIEKRVRELRGLFLAGNAYHGVGIPDCIHSGELAAQAVLESLEVSVFR